MNAAVQSAPQTKKTDDLKFPSSLLTMYGVMTAIMVFHSQFELVELSGRVSRCCLLQDKAGSLKNFEDFENLESASLGPKRLR